MELCEKRNFHVTTARRPHLGRNFLSVIDVNDGTKKIALCEQKFPPGGDAATVRT